MALSLLKGSAVKKLMVFLLLTFSGLGYPEFGEALKCVKCQGKMDNDKEVDCVKQPNFIGNDTCPQNNGCGIVRRTTNGSGTVDKICMFAYTKPMFECIKKKMDQLEGPCFKGYFPKPGNIGMLGESVRKCEKELLAMINGTMSNTERAQAVEGPSSEDNQNQDLLGDRQDNANYYKYEEAEYCRCEEDLCNAKDLRTVQGTGGMGGKGAGRSTGGNSTKDADKSTKGTGYMLAPAGLMAAITGILITGILKWMN